MRIHCCDPTVKLYCFNRPAASSVTSSMAFCATVFLVGCGGTTPSAPPPKNGYHTERQTYAHKPTPNIPVSDLTDCILLAENTPVRELSLPRSLRVGNIVGFKGTIVHPDARMTGGFIMARVTYTDEHGIEVIANESSGDCKGKDGRLPFEFELRLLKATGPIRQHVIRLTFQGLPPGQKVGEPPGNWVVPVAEQSIDLSE